MSEQRLTSLADLPTTKGVTAEQYNRERKAAKRRNQEAHEAVVRKKKDRKEREGIATSITWLDPPVMVGRFRVVGVSSDASDEVKREYGV